MDDTNVMTDAAGIVERLSDAARSSGGSSFTNGCVDCGLDANLCHEAAATIVAQAAELQRLREVFKGAAISETVDSGRWSLTLHFGKGESACIRMRDAADIIRNLTGAS